MIKKGLYIILFFGCMCNAQIVCPKIEEPINGATDVAVDAPISWSKIDGINGYSVSVGTSPEASDILNSRSASLVNFLEPTTGLPANTEIFVTISLFLDDNSFITCPSEKFTTINVLDPPQCTTLSGPLLNAQNVKLGENISWNYAPTASGYMLTIGSSDGSSDILSETDVGNTLTYNPPNNLPTSSDIFVTVVPYNKNGKASNCSASRFTTGSLNINCEQFKPKITLKDSFGICSNSEEVRIETNDIADGFRWYKVQSDGTENLIVEASSVVLSEIGQYRYEAYNGVSISGDTTECSSSSSFVVLRSESAIIEGVGIEQGPFGVSLTVLASGLGSYEFAIDNADGPFQEINVFHSVSDDDHVIYARDTNGCSISTYSVFQNLSENDFPDFFTPNNDGTNDYWNFTPSLENSESLDTVTIFDRFGRVLIQLQPESLGWDGTFEGNSAPSSTYWYSAVAKNGKILHGYFALKR